MKCVVGEKELCYTFRQEASCYKVDTLPDLQKKGGDADGYIPDPGVIVFGRSEVGFSLKREANHFVGDCFFL